MVREKQLADCVLNMQKVNNMTSNLYILKNDIKRKSSIPLISLRSIENIILAWNDRSAPLSQVEMNVFELLKKIEIKRLTSLHKTFVFDFNISGTDISYSYDQLGEAIRKNIGETNAKKLEASVELMNDIVKYAVSQVDDIFDFHRDEENRLATKRDPILERFIEVLESQTYENVWSDIMKYPFDNQTHGIRKHLIFGVAASTGKSIILEAIGKLYEAAAAFKQNRPENGFDAANWNADVIERFVVLLDDDDPNRQLNEDYLKNFMSNNMPQQLARGGGQRWSEVYNGSSVVALNSAPAFLKNPQNNKRVIFMKLDKSVEELFTQAEFNHLHNLDPQSILSYVNTDETKLFDWHNDWSDVIEDERDNVINFVRARGVVANKELVSTFDKKTVKAAAEKAGWKIGNVTVHGETIYGYKDATGVIDQPYQSEKLTFAAFEDLHKVIGERNFETPEEFAKDVLEFGKIEKDKQPLFSTAIFHDEIKKENVTGFIGVVIDIDGANASSFDKLVEKVRLTGLSAVVWETSSSTPADIHARVWFYRVGGDLEESAELVKRLALKIDEPYDRSGLPVEHRFFVGGTNVQVVNNTLKTEEISEMSNNNKRSLIRTVQNAIDGTRESKAYWALMVIKQETGDIDFMNELIDQSGLREENKTKLRKQFKL